MVDINNGGEIDDDSYREILRERQLVTGGSLGALATAPNISRVLAIPAPNVASQPWRGGLAGLLISRPPSVLDYLNPLGGGIPLPPSQTREATLSKAGYSITLTNPIEFFSRKFPGKPIFRYIQSHPDLDHMRGLSAIQSQGIQILNFWDSEHSKIPAFKNDADRREWMAYTKLRSSTSTPTVRRLVRGNIGAYWNSDPTGYGDHDSIEILSPTPEIVRRANQQGNSNNLSYVIRITHLNYRVVLGGDADASVWEELANVYGMDLRCDVYKASHHGRDSGYSANALKLMRPKYAIVSVGKKPDTDASNKYRNYCDKVWSTRWYGNLRLEISQKNGINWFADYPKGV